MKPLSIPAAAEGVKKPDERQYLTSWKEIAEYMRCGVRTVQRYERELGLPVRRPTGKSRGSVMATRVEIDAWITAGAVRETFTLKRISPTRTPANGIEEGLTEMRQLREQMRALRTETRTALKVLIDRVSATYVLMPPARHSGYEPLTNMDMGMDMDVDMDMKRRPQRESDKSGGKLNLAAPNRARKSSARQRRPGPLSTVQKPN